MRHYFCFYSLSRSLSGVSTLPNPKSSPVAHNWTAPVSASSTSSRPRRPVSESDSDPEGSPPPRRDGPRLDSRYKYGHFFIQFQEWTTKAPRSLAQKYSKTEAIICTSVISYFGKQLFIHAPNPFLSLQSSAWSLRRPGIFPHRCSPRSTKEGQLTCERPASRSAQKHANNPVSLWCTRPRLCLTPPWKYLLYL